MMTATEKMMYDSLRHTLTDLINEFEYGLTDPSDPHYQRTLDNIEYAASLLDAYTFDRALSEFLTMLMHDIEQLRAQIKQKEEEESQV